MKVRNGFVSNSSSSSFIVAFPHLPTSLEDLKTILFDDETVYPNPYVWTEKDPYGWPVSEVAETVWGDLQRRGIINKAEALEVAKTGYVDGADQPDWLVATVPAAPLEGRSKLWEDYQEKWDAANSSVASEFLKTVPDGYVLAHFEYSDNDGPYFTALEHGPLFYKVRSLRVSHH